MTGVLLGDTTYRRAPSQMAPGRVIAPKIAEYYASASDQVAVVSVRFVVSHETDDAHVDLVGFASGTARWWVGAVFPQTALDPEEVVAHAVRLRRARYLTEHVEEVLAELPDDADLDLAELSRMMLEDEPVVIQFVSDPDPSLSDRLRDADALMGVAEVWDDGQGHQLLRINGSSPPGVPQLLGEYRMLKPGLLDLHDVPSGELPPEVNVICGGRAAPCQCVGAGDSTVVRLHPFGSELDAIARMRIFRLSDNHLMIERLAEDD